MIICLPDGLRDDELLYSALARSARMLPPAAPRDVVAAAYGTRTGVASIDLPARLDEAGTRILNLVGDRSAGGKLLRLHTLFPYYASVVEPAVAARAARAMRGDGGGLAHGLLGVRASRVHAPAHLRYCPECARTDRADLGEPWWRRAHQLPGSLVCPRHGAVLVDSSRRTSSARQRRAFHALDASISPDDCPCLDPVAAERDVPRLLSIARASAALLAVRGLDALGIDALWSRRRDALTAHGLLERAGGRVDVAALREVLLDRHGGVLLERLGCPVDRRAGDDWVSRLARPPRRSVHPLYHVLLSEALGGTSFEVDVPQSAADRSGAESACFPMARPTGAGPEPAVAGFGARLAELVAEPGRSLRAIARELGVDPLTVQRRAHALGLWRPGWAMRPTVLPRTTAADRSVVSLEEARRAWSSARTADPSATRSQLRGREPAVYARLYRRDRDWLAANSPAPARSCRRPVVDWPTRDALVAAAVDRAGAELRAEGARSRPVRPATLAGRADFLSVIEQHVACMPLTAAALTRWSQDGREMAVERIRGVAADWATDRAPPSRSVLARAAGIGPSRAAALSRALEAARSFGTR